MRIAVQGCGHGQLDQIYAQLENHQNRQEIDLLIICGDFQAMRNHVDVQTMACPQKYRQLGRFHEYYSGHKKAPVLTLVIGGNHESAAYMWELYWGGWLAPQIYYLGAAGVVEVKLRRKSSSSVETVRISGLSGIYKPYHFKSSHYERPPFHPNSPDIHSIYHVRRFDIEKMMRIKEPVDIMLSHDWPRNIYHHGDLNALLKRKPFFKADIDNGNLGSPALEQILYNLKPLNWFAAHMHVNFQATIVHHTRAEENDDGEEPSLKKSRNSCTRFEALDKCGPNKIHFKLFDIEPSKVETGTDVEEDGVSLYFDREWLAITRATNDFLSTSKTQPSFPVDLDLDTHRRWVDENINDLRIPDNFCQTAPGLQGDYRYRLTDQEYKEAKRAHINPQSIAFCQMLQISNKFAEALEESNRANVAEIPEITTDAPISDKNQDEIVIDDDEFL